MGDEVDDEVAKLRAAGWDKKAAPDGSTPASAGVYLVHWRKSGIQAEWIITKDGQLYWRGYSLTDLAERKRMIEQAPAGISTIERGV